MDKKIIQSKKSQISLIWAFIYDLVFVVVFVTTLFVFINKVDSGMHYWRLYYAKDMALTLNLVESIPDSEAITINYGVINRKVISNNPINLILSIRRGSGIIELINEQETRERTKERYLTRKDSTLQIYEPLRVLSITKDSGITQIHADIGTQCNKYDLEPDFFINKSVHIIKETDHFVTFKNNFLSLLEVEYSSQLPGADLERLRNILFNKNIRHSEDVADIVIKLNFIESEDFKNIRIKYFGESNNLFLANNIACSSLLSLKEEYGSIDLAYPANIIFESSRANEIRYDKNTNAAVVYFEFKGKTLDDFDNQHDLARLIIETIKDNTEVSPTIDFVNELKQEHGLN